MVIPITTGMTNKVTSRQLFLIAIGNMVTLTTIDKVMHIESAAMTTDIGLILNEMDIMGTARTL